MISTKNFNPTTDPKLLCTCGHSQCDKRSVKQLYLNQVQLIREDADRPLVITSAGRCPYHPNEIHRKEPADHQKCAGVDIFYANVLERNELMVLAGRHGANAVAAGKNFVHMGWRSDIGNRIATWEYN
jgi:zinc D-Ala-D-Ala carboxypeptidase